MGSSRSTRPTTAAGTALPSNYWDVTSFGYQDAFLNAYFYGALEAMAQLEEHVGGAARADELRTVRKKVRQRYNTLFWNGTAGRYVQSIDADGVAHDYGSTYVNLEAASFGLPTEDQARRIFEWLDHGQTELQEAVVQIEEGGLAPKITAGHTLGQSFTADADFVSVAARFATYGARGAAFTMTLYRGLPGQAQVKIAEQKFSDWCDGGVAHLDLRSSPRACITWRSPRSPAPSPGGRATAAPARGRTRREARYRRVAPVRGCARRLLRGARRHLLGVGLRSEVDHPSEQYWFFLTTSRLPGANRCRTAEQSSIPRDST